MSGGTRKAAAGEETRVLILHRKALTAASEDQTSTSGADDSASTSSSLTSFTLPEARSGKPVTYLLGNGVLQEVNRFKQMYSAWLIGDRLLADGSMFLASPVDPLFVLLPFLEAGRNQDGTMASSGNGSSAAGLGLFKPLDELLYDASCPALADVGHAAEVSLPCICDVKRVGPDAFYRLNDERVLAWLACKARQVRAALPSHVAGMDAAAADAYAVAFLAEYIHAGWLERLTKRLGAHLHNSSGGDVAGDAQAAADGKGNAGPAPHNGNGNATAHTQPTGATAAAVAAEKKPKLDPKAVAAQKAAETRATNQVEKLKKHAEGTKKISAFYVKK